MIQIVVNIIIYRQFAVMRSVVGIVITAKSCVNFIIINIIIHRL